MAGFYGAEALYITVIAGLTNHFLWNDNGRFFHLIYCSLSDFQDNICLEGYLQFLRSVISPLRYSASF